MPTVKRVASTKRPTSVTSDSTLLARVERHVVDAAAAKQDKRDTEHIHPSEICKANWCPRATFYRISGANSQPEQVAYRTQAIFEEGTNIHEKWQRWFWQMGILFGWWKCKECGTKWEALSPPQCPECFSQAIEYKEVPIVDEEHLIIGHSDGRIGDQLLEIKSVGTGTVRYIAPNLFKQFSSGDITLDQMWRNIKRPFGEHLKQGMLYLHCTGLKEIIFIYECKWNQQVKEFTIEYSKDIVQPMLDGCKEVKRALRNDLAPDRPKWALPEHKDCKKCPYRLECYGEVDSQGDGTTGTTRERVVRRASTSERRRVSGADKATRPRSKAAKRSH